MKPPKYFTILLFPSADYRRHELSRQSTMRRKTIGHSDGCRRIGRVRVLRCGKHRPEGGLDARQRNASSDHRPRSTRVSDNSNQRPSNEG